MNLTELKQLVDHAMQQCERTRRSPDTITVRIPSYKTGVAGHIPCTDVKSARMGFDWEASSFLIRPSEELREISRDEVKDLRAKYEELSWTHYKVSKIKKENEALKEQISKLKGTE